MDWSEEGFDEQQHATLRRQAAASRRPPSSAGASGSGPRSPSPRPRPHPPRGRAPGSRSPSPSPRRGGPAPRSGSPSPRRAAIMATRVGSSVRTTSRSPPPRTPTGGGDPEDGTGAAEILGALASMREGLAARRGGPGPGGGGGGSGSDGSGGRAESDDEDGGAAGFAGFSFPEVGSPPSTDGTDVLDAFVGSEEARRAKAAAAFLEATMGANTGPRTEAIKAELLVNGRLLDLPGLERWMRWTDAVAELDWFAGLCGDDAGPLPEIEFFECAFRALESAAADVLPRGADARRRWVGSVRVPEFFVCPVSKMVMEDPVVIPTGKTVDRSAMEKWQKKYGSICPVTGEMLWHTTPIPNTLMKHCIAHWRAANEIPEATAGPDQPAISRKVETLFKLVTLMPHSPLSSKDVRDELFLLHELLIEHESAIVHLLGRHPETITKLASVLPETCLHPDPELDDIIIEILARAATDGRNKMIFGDDQYAIPVLIARTLLGLVPTRARCAHILGLLADEHYNKIKISELGGITPLVELLLVGDKGVKKTAARAIASLCETPVNRSRFLRERVVDATISALRSDGLVVEAQAIFLQAMSFDPALADVVVKLDENRGDPMCAEVRLRIWNTFVLAKPEGKSKKTWERPSTSSNARPSDSSEGTSSEKEQMKKDAKTIVSWLQKKCDYPRTYRYRD